MRKRTAGREIALKFLFMRDLRGPDVDAELEEFLAAAEGGADAKRFARVLVTGYLADAGHLDRTIDQAADNWDLRRMAAVDRNILRIAAFELLGDSPTPARVAINEAIELGKKYGSSRSAAFINGILDRIRRSTAETEGALDGEA